jgi:hypothetical protein
VKLISSQLRSNESVFLLTAMNSRFSLLKSPKMLGVPAKEDQQGSPGYEVITPVNEALWILPK